MKGSNRWGLPVSMVILLAWALVSAAPAASELYFVSRNGSDSADGLSEQAAFATIERGISALGPGDTLEILPGEYFESVSRIRLQGTEEAPITIRARRPGTVIMRGDRDLAGFEPVPGRAGVYQAPFDGPVAGVADPRSRRLLVPLSTLNEVEYNLDTFFHDAENGRLFVRTLDSSPPGTLRVSVTDGFGLHFQDSRHLVVEGLTFTGYNQAEYGGKEGTRVRWAMYFQRGERITVRDCRFFMNSGGLHFLGSRDSLAENCLAAANRSFFQGIGANINAWGGSGMTFRNNTVMNSWLGPTGSASDITFYSGRPGNRSVMEGNLAVDSSIMIKGESWDEEQGRALQERNLSVGRGAGFYRIPAEPSNLRLSRLESEYALVNFADPVNLDFRLQSDAPLRGSGPEGADPGPFPYRDEVFFVSPEGDDANPGTSLRRPWRTLARAAAAAGPGDTVYIQGGEYREALVPAASGAPGRPVRFRRHGHDRVVLDGGGSLPAGIDLSGRSFVEVEGLVVRGFLIAGVLADGGGTLRVSGMIVENCGSGALFHNFETLEIENCYFRDNRFAGLILSGSGDATVSGNLFSGDGPALTLGESSLEGLWSDYNCFTPGAVSIARLGGAALAGLDEWRAASGQDGYSISAGPGFSDEGALLLAPDSPLVGAGPAGSIIGPFRRLTREAPLEVTGVSVRSVTDTTANIECRTPAGNATAYLEWGETPELGNRLELTPATYHVAGLTGLEPGRSYYFRMTAGALGTNFISPAERVRLAARQTPETVEEGDGDAPVPSTGDDGEAEKAMVLLLAPFDPPDEFSAGGKDAPVGTFTTLAERPAARTFHVSPDGDDAADGLSRAGALRTVSAAAGLVRAGDTVLIHEGSYGEYVLVKATGDREAPITFRAAAGEKAWLDGERFRATGIRLPNISHITLDGLRFRNFKNQDWVYAVEAAGGGGHRLRRLLYDGRVTEGYETVFFGAWRHADLLFENCVVIGGMGQSLVLDHCPGAVIRHNVFYIPNIRVMSLTLWDPSYRTVLSHNILFDSLPGKSSAPPIRTMHLEAVVSDHNLFYLRTSPMEERDVIETMHIGGELAGREASGSYRGARLTLQRAREEFGLDRGSVFGNPGLPVVAELEPRLSRDPALNKPGWRQHWLRNELHFNPETGDFEELDFHHFIADPAGPFGRSAAGRPIGLDPAAFE